ncbi:MltA-interacting MipA family protein [Psychromonas sp. psych-6C06]|uniref:MipA/OmpV family protein n=1 Tax=Psychromonas sp. psych-6C06 TaxID=2058089 RepID=UPI000C33D4A3|nr:MipA/OmpV family protein [Psychromonas sp. psych-6C06]PKF61706.1 MltA-interacting MipA family protein [Psychromonas sp. psych-6C06]
MPLFYLFLFIFPSALLASEALNSETKATWSETVPDWGIAIGVRNASIPYDISQESHVNDFVPKMYYEGEYIFLRGESGGLRFYQEEKFSASILGRYRYFDIPKEFQREYKGTNIDMGLQFEYLLQPHFPLQLELLSDVYGNSYGNANLRYQIDHNDWDIDLYSTFRYKSGEFNNLYYGFGQDDIGSDLDIKFGTEARYHLFSNLYLLGEMSINVLGNHTYQSELINSRVETEYYLGFGFFNDKKNQETLTLPDNHYLRLAYGWATPSNIGEIINGDTEKDEYNNRLSSLFYGIPLTESIFGLPIEFYFTPGFVYHFNSEVQDPLTEYVLAIKAYYTFTWPVRWRFGFAEGLSYVSDITYIEHNDDPDNPGSKILNYLDFTLDVNLGDVTNVKALDKLWLGYSIHHRSAIFESSSMFGRSKGGSNYNTIYLQWHF